MVEDKLDDKQIDVLREISNIGSGRALTDLEKYTKVGIREGLPYLDFMSMKDIPDFLGDFEERIISVYAPITGDIYGTFVALFPYDSALILVDLAFDKSIHSTTKLTRDDEILIEEISISLFKSYLEAIIELLDIRVSLEKSIMLKGYGCNILTESDSLKRDQLSLVLETSFGIPQYEFEGDFVLIIDTASIDALLNAAQKKFGF